MDDTFAFKKDNLTIFIMMSFILFRPTKQLLN